MKITQKYYEVILFCVKMWRIKNICIYVWKHNLKKHSPLFLRSGCPLSSASCWRLRLLELFSFGDSATLDLPRVGAGTDKYMRCLDILRFAILRRTKKQFQTHTAHTHTHISLSILTKYQYILRAIFISNTRF